MGQRLKCKKKKNDFNGTTQNKNADFNGTTQRFRKKADFNRQTQRLKRALFIFEEDPNTRKFKKNTDFNGTTQNMSTLPGQHGGGDSSVVRAPDS